MANFNCPYNPTVDYFAILGVHQLACPKTVKLAYRKLARRYHPDVSKIHDAQKKFQQIAEAYEILSKYRDAYLHDFQRRNRAVNGNSRTSKSQSTNAHQSKRSRSASERDDKEKKSTQGTHSFYEKAYRKQKPIDGKDRVITYPLTLRYAIRLLRLGSFYIPGLKVKMKFTREALMGKTFRLQGKGYSGLFGGKPGDFLVRFEVKNESIYWQLKGADIYGTFHVASQLLTEGKLIKLEAPSGSFSVEVPSDYAAGHFILVENMGLPSDDSLQAGHLYARLIAA
ncbi:MAG: DnaJ domain-containing protein [Thiomicrorhabdus chilensis]|uniref:DnaJ domain-containing protein n=1 Tax=Thiomicrorhabdus chilensis TaxID=63656 RepID=UPI00299D7D3A|nr:DnaJ domain-containing protein [Thiomicrorhabdus chilensis]MDX1348333.1 DnaJ domain-containing protein [Thiomicrorhabdus chilensis]